LHAKAVIPAKAGIQFVGKTLDSGFRRNDDVQLGSRYNKGS